MYTNHILKKNRAVSLLTAVLMVCAMLTVILPEDVWAEETETTIYGITYTVTGTGTAKVSGADKSNLSADAAILSKVKIGGKSYTVTSIGDAAFYGCSGLQSVTIPSSVTSIKNDAFYRSAALSWQKADRAEGCQIWRASSKNGKYSLRYSTRKTSTVNTSLTCGKTYYYKIRTYRTVNGKKVYSSYTSVQKKTTR